MFHDEWKSVTASEPVEQPRMGDVLLLEEFSGVDVPQLRLACYRVIVQAGLVEDWARRFALAIRVGLVNAVQHGGGSGVLRLLRDGGSRLVAEIVDQGAGRTVAPPRRPQPSGESGLSLAQRLVDDVALWSGPEGSTLRLVMTISDSRMSRDPVP
jgi:serine/threonine-protein kinase RsbW